MSRALFYVTLFAVTVLAVMPTYEPLPMNEWIRFSDVLNHFAAFTVLYLLHARGFAWISPLHRSTLLLLYGIGIEIVQSFLPNRSASFADILVDATALLFAMLLHRFYRLKFHAV